MFDYHVKIFRRWRCACWLLYHPFTNCCPSLHLSIYVYHISIRGFFGISVAYIFPSHKYMYAGKSSTWSKACFAALVPYGWAECTLWIHAGLLGAQLRAFTSFPPGAFQAACNKPCTRQNYKFSESIQSFQTETYAVLGSCTYRYFILYLCPFYFTLTFLCIVWSEASVPQKEFRILLWCWSLLPRQCCGKARMAVLCSQKAPAAPQPLSHQPVGRTFPLLPN